jgi:hypothetical protein
MAKESSSYANLPENPLLARLLVAVGATSAITLRGYVVPSRADGYVILYPRLDTLSESHEVARADILFFTEVPESVMPFGGMMIWVKTDAQIIHRQGDTAERADLAEVRKGRLRILMPLRRRLGEVVDCRSLPPPPCQSRCTPPPCQSRCNACQAGGD